MLRLDALRSPDSPVDAGAMYGASDASLTTRLLACLLASSCLCGLQAAGLPIEDCGVSMASLLRCTALRCNIGGLQQIEPWNPCNALRRRGAGAAHALLADGMAAWNASLPPDTLADADANGCYSMSPCDLETWSKRHAGLD